MQLQKNNDDDDDKQKNDDSDYKKVKTMNKREKESYIDFFTTRTKQSMLYVFVAYFYLILFSLIVSSVHSLRVENLRESNKDISSITIEWTISGDDSVNEDRNLTNGDDGEWLGFKIKYFTTKLQFTPVLLRNTLLRKFRLDNLKSNTEYKIQVSAFNRLENEGPASNLLSVRTLESGKLKLQKKEGIVFQSQ